ncbi:two-component regulator propeller domain-containing protein [Lutibacter aestuarii]|uniref:Two-component regulator propeller domain-containing protein n=1 Tax=Lutibacter aestuarii TaxID=861111 RepID=A0ABW2Z6D3_9FLAO
MLIIRYLLFFLLFLNSFINLKAQEFSFIDNVTISTKLQNHNIISIEQDSNGFLWIGTNLGLYRYDGYNFIAYNITSNPSLLDNNIRSLLIDNNNLWIASKGGINVLNLNTKVMQSYIHLENDKRSIPNNYVTKLFKDKNNTIWIGYNTNSISKYLGNNHFQNFKIKDVSTNSTINEILEMPNNNLIIEATELESNIKKIALINSSAVKIIRTSKESPQTLFQQNSVTYLATENKILKYQLTTQSFVDAGIKFNEKENLQGLAFTDKNNKVYLGTNNGTFYLFSLETNNVFLKINIGKSETWINSFFVDSTGLLWIATATGLYKFKQKQNLFRNHLHSLELSKANKIRSIIQDVNNDIYTVNQTDLFKYDSISKTFKNLNWTNKINSSPFSLLELDSLNLFVGTQGGGLGIYNKKTNVLRPYFKKNKFNNYNNHIFKIFKDENDIVWFGTRNGLKYYNSQKGEIESLANDNLNKDIIYDIKSNKKGSLWIGTSTGLFHLKVIYNNNNDLMMVNVSKIRSIFYEIRTILINKGTLWLATQSNGILKYDINTHRIKIFNEFQGLSNNTTYSILPGFKNDIWVGTLHGLSRLDTLNNLFVNFYDFNGLADNEFNSSSQLKSKNGELFMGGQNGISSFFPEDFDTDITNFKLNITKVSWYSSTKDSTMVINVDNNNLKSLTLPYDNTFVNFEFSVSDYLQPENNKYKYKFSGLQNEWRLLSKTNVLSFTNLPPGEYNLEVMASTNYGKWSKQSIKIPITVKQIYYKRWWFITFLGGFMVLIGFSIRRYELGHIKKMEELRLRISRDLHDELGSALTGIAIRAELLSEKLTIKAKDKVLSQISIQSREAVDTLSDIVWAIDSRNNSLQNLSDRMNNVMYLLLTPKNITFNLDAIEEKKSILLKQDYRQHVFLIFKEAITNIIKHSNATHVSVSFFKDKKSIRLRIQDNGKNISLTRDKLNGNGINNMRLRAVKMKSHLEIFTKDGFTIELWIDYLNK